MIFIIPFIIGAIGVAVGAVGGAFAAHAAGEKDRQESKSHRQINNDLVVKYSKLQQLYYEIEDRNKTENKYLQEQLILSEIEKDTLNLLVELQQEIIYLIVSIDKSPSFSAVDYLKKAVSYTNLVLSKFNKQPILLPDDYILRNLGRSFCSANGDEDRAYYFYLYGKVLHDEGNYQDAIRGYNEAIKLDRLNYLIHFQKSKLLTDIGAYKEALSSIEIAISIEDNDPSVWGERALIYSFLGDFKNELKSYQTALCIEPNYHQSCYEYAVMSEGLGNRQQAIKYYNQAIKIKPNFAEAYHRRGHIHLQISDEMDRYDKEIHNRQGIQDLDKAQKLWNAQAKPNN